MALLSVKESGPAQSEKHSTKLFGNSHSTTRGGVALGKVLKGNGKRERLKVKPSDSFLKRAP